MFLKQYGARRSGTNLVRALVGRAFPGVRVLMHALGHKHAPPCDLRALLEETRSEDEPALTFAERATWPGGIDDEAWTNNGAVDYLAGMADALRACCERGAMAYVVSVRDPYTWAAALAEWRCWIDDEGAYRPWIVDDLRTACEELDGQHAAWLRLRDRVPDRVVVVPYERLSANPDSVLTDIGARFGLGAPRPVEIRHRVMPAMWDHLPERFGEPYPSERVRSRSDLRTLPEGLRDLVTHSIDWRLAGAFGYLPWDEA